MRVFSRLSPFAPIRSWLCELGAMLTILLAPFGYMFLAFVASLADLGSFCAETISAGPGAWDSLNVRLSICSSWSLFSSLVKFQARSCSNKNLVLGLP